MSVRPARKQMFVSTGAKRDGARWRRGGAALEASQVDPASRIFEGKRLEGFWLTACLRRKSILSQLCVSRQVQGLLARDLKTEIQARLPLEEAARGLEQYAANMTGRKILLMPSRAAGGQPGP
jgi:hypothetical protein